MARATRDLAEEKIDKPRLEAEILLAHFLGVDRVSVHVNNQRDLSDGQNTAYSQIVHRRLNHEPTAYITGHKEFFGIDFRVSRHTLIPRPETELLVENAVQLASGFLDQSCLIADIGTGCGAIAIALSLHLPKAVIYATDISAPALEMARGNCLQHKVGNTVTLLHGDLLDPLPERVHLMVANLPYINEVEMDTLPPEIAKFEPHAALAGGRDGLRQIERLLRQAKKKLLPGGTIVLEIGYQQGQAVSLLSEKYMPNARVDIIQDLAGLDRAVIIHSPPP